MKDSDLSKKLTWMIALLAANLLVTIVMAGALVLGLLPKIERAVQTTERVEARFQSFADEVQPVVTAGAGKAIETIKKMDADRLSETATEKTDSLLDAAAEKAKRFLDRDEKQDE
ncbi:hypothetical protein [Lignipirellula cremea]|uniref:Uncharacterized protein n=1 Tax=Lignipirellula cremea TaxID=2528010 RepID=A0A518DY29_9BACT|nr:hypothetical protein [Lignipirellula cremea]QDU96748.1 hypothetical protein Pla8534_45690 [Lignipirellula cremea]